MKKYVLLVLPVLSACSHPVANNPEKPYRKTFTKPSYVLHKARPVTAVQTANLIREEAKRQGVPVNFALAVAYIESRINPHTKASHKGAVGPMQVMRGTARQFDPSLTIDQIKDPRINIPLGVAYLKLGLIQTGNNLHATAARYEAGLGSKRLASHYSHKVMSAMRSNTAVAFLDRHEPERTLNDVPVMFAVFEPEQTFKKEHVKVNRKVQGRLGEPEPSKVFTTPIGSLVYDPNKFNSDPVANHPVMLARDGGLK